MRHATVRIQQKGLSDVPVGLIFSTLDFDYDDDDDDDNNNNNNNKLQKTAILGTAHILRKVLM
jgi:hypothetical protein